MFLADFDGDPETERKGINAWVAKKTRDLISELLGEGVITRDTTMVLVNAFYLEAPWADPLVVELTETAPFTKLDGSSFDAQMMHSSELEGGGDAALMLLRCGPAPSPTVTEAMAP